MKRNPCSLFLWRNGAAHAIVVVLLFFIHSFAVLHAQDILPPPPGQQAEGSRTSGGSMSDAGSSQEEDEAGCLGRYTPLSCTTENVKFAELYSWVMLLIAPLLSCALFAFLRVRSWWWTLIFWQRLVVFSVLFFLLLWPALLMMFPFVPQVSPVPMEAGLLRFAGIDPAFVESCLPCRTRVEKPALLWGLIPLFPRQGLVVENVIILFVLPLFMFMAWGGLTLALYLWRRRKALQPRPGK